MDTFIKKLTKDNITKDYVGSKGDLVRYKVTFNMEEYQFEVVYAGIYERMNFELKKAVFNIGFSVTERNINFVTAYMSESRVDRYITWILGLFNDIIDAENLKTSTYISLQTMEDDYNSYIRRVKENEISEVS